MAYILVPIEIQVFEILASKADERAKEVSKLNRYGCVQGEADSSMRPSLHSSCSLAILKIYKSCQAVIVFPRPPSRTQTPALLFSKVTGTCDRICNVPILNGLDVHY